MRVTQGPVQHQRGPVHVAPLAHVLQVHPLDVDPRPLDASNAGSQADDTSTVVENSAQPNANAARSGTAVPCADGQESATAVLTPNTTASPPQGPS